MLIDLWMWQAQKDMFRLSVPFSLQSAARAQGVRCHTIFMHVPCQCILCFTACFNRATEACSENVLPIQLSVHVYTIKRLFKYHSNSVICLGYGLYLLVLIVPFPPQDV